MKKLLIVSQIQFGYLIDYYQYSNHLNKEYEIIYLCWDYNLQRLEINGVNVIYISRNGNLLKRNIRFLISIIRHIRIVKFDIILVNYFIGCFILPIFKRSQSKINLDIRTASVSVSQIKGICSDRVLLLESFFYKNISVISEGVRKRLKLKRNVRILPLGANELCRNRIELTGLNLLYVGTLSNRNIHQTINGVYQFHKKYPEINVSYKIIGTGNELYENLIKESIKDNNLSEIVSLLGYIPTDQLEPYFYNSNIGVSYVPITDYYFFQPPTKTYEYLMAGMPVLATKTFGNSEIINNHNGVLIDDNSNDFFLGLEKIMNSKYDLKKILKSVENNTWSRISTFLSSQILNKE